MLEDEVWLTRMPPDEPDVPNLLAGGDKWLGNDQLGHSIYRGLFSLVVGA